MIQDDLKLLLEETDNLLAQGFTKEQILLKLKIDSVSRAHAKEVLFKIDNAIVAGQIRKQSKYDYSTTLFLGVTIFMIGMLTTIGTYMLGYSQYVLSYGAILIGAWLIKEGYKDSKSKVDTIDLKPKRFGKNRKFKKYGD